jgi:subtilisin family serine protease
VQRVYNGMAVLTNAEQRQAIARLPGVAAIHPLIPKLPHNAASIPYLGVPAIWQYGAGSGAPGGLRGEGIRVAVIDTGIDYLHRDFAGSGNGYAQNDPTVVGDVPDYPGLRIAGGYDFVGDNYNASVGQPSYQPLPQPDPDPMDCYGHGTHVAGTLAGSGVTASGATFAGPYDQRVDFASLEIGPGVAPRANVYALKIFGCTGSTNVTDLALEWAVDPNRDGDFA